MARRRKTLSQNFLNDPGTVRRFVRTAGLHPEEPVLEPGAGEGMLTRALAARARRVIAYEIDRPMASRLSRRLSGLPHVRVVGEDFLCARPPREPFAVAGNIPFAATSGIVRWCLDAPRLTSATLLTQLEYARKRTGDYGRWSLLTVQTWPEYEWRLLGRVERRHFTPVPRTDCAILRIERRPVPLLPPERLADYRAFVADGFSGVGGSLAATLAGRHPARQVRAACRAAGVDREQPVGLVAPGQWLTLFHQLSASHTPGGAADRAAATRGARGRRPPG